MPVCDNVTETDIKQQNMCYLCVQEPGDEMGYMYDEGDEWKHTIRFITAYSCKNSTGRCQVYIRMV